MPGEPVDRGSLICQSHICPKAQVSVKFGLSPGSLEIQKPARILIFNALFVYYLKSLFPEHPHTLTKCLDLSSEMLRQVKVPKSELFHIRQWDGIELAGVIFIEFILNKISMIIESLTTNRLFLCSSYCRKLTIGQI